MNKKDGESLNLRVLYFFLYWNEYISHLNKTTESNKNNGSSNQGQQNKESTTFYDSITHGKKEFSSESEALRRGSIN